MEISLNSRRKYCRFVAYLIGVLLVVQTFDITRCESGILLQRKQSDSAWQWLTMYKFRAGTGWSRDGITGSYVICDIASTATNHTDSWLVSEFIQSNDAKEIVISLTFTTRECPVIYPYCVTYLNVFVLFTDEPLPGGVTKQAIIDGNFMSIGNATATVTWKSGQSPQDNVVNVTQVVSKKNLYLAFQDIGSCIALKEVSVTYRYCPSVTSNGVTFNKTFAPALRDAEVNVTGRCLDHASSLPANSSLVARCLTNGDWTMDNNIVCLCEPGFEMVLGKCKSCSSGMYKATLGNHACTQCASHSHPPLSRDQCQCNSGYHRAVDDLVNASCSAPPSKPRDLKTTIASPSVAIVMWSPPIDNGGRNDVKYDVMCQKCISGLCIYTCNDVSFWPANRNVLWTHVTMSGVSAEVTYRVTVLAKNGVSDVAGVGYHANVSVMVTIPALTTKLSTTGSPTNITIVDTATPVVASSSNVSAAIGISVACTFIFCLLVGLIIAYILIHKYKLRKIQFTRTSSWRNYAKQLNDSGTTSSLTELTVPSQHRRASMDSFENHTKEDVSETDFGDSPHNGHKRNSTPQAWLERKSNFDSKNPQLDRVNKNRMGSVVSTRSWFPQNDIQYGI